MILCRDCKFYLQHCCRRHAPTLVVIKPETGITEAKWPHVWSGESCGDGELKEEQHVQ